jgi:hypothetical protein
MRVFWRSLLLWLMALALPMQGLAAAARMHCAAQAPMSASAVHVDAHASHHAGQHARHHADPEHPIHAHHLAADVDGTPHGDADAPRAGHSCSACAACHAPVGLPPARVMLPAPPVASFTAAALADAGASHVPAGLDRPPRPTTA